MSLETQLQSDKVRIQQYQTLLEISEAIASNQSARVYLDSNPKQPLEAVVARIDPQASFTPENTYYRDDRVKQVVGVKMQLTNSQGFAKPGMPADGEVLVEGDKWVATNRI